MSQQQNTQGMPTAVLEVEAPEMVTTKQVCFYSYMYHFLSFNVISRGQLHVGGFIMTHYSVGQNTIQPDELFDV